MSAGLATETQLPPDWTKTPAFEAINMPEPKRAHGGARAGADALVPADRTDVDRTNGRG